MGEFNLPGTASPAPATHRSRTHETPAELSSKTSRPNRHVLCVDAQSAAGRITLRQAACIKTGMNAQPKLTDLADPKRQAAVETVSSILREKGCEVWSIAPEATVYEAISLMAEKRAGALAVTSGSELTGIISERDYARKVILQGKSSKHTPVADVMSSPVITVTPRHTVPECLRMVTELRIRHLPVVDEGRLCGLISIGDLVRSVLAMQAHTIDELATYIANKYPK
jgi:CBS domain-containing protein